MADDRSNLKPYSLGIVVETKPQGVDYILVTPVETMNIQPEGSIKDHSKEFKGNQKDLESTSFKTEHQSKNYIKAKWLPFGESNRTSAPDVAASETVMLYKFGDVDEYFWFDVMREPELRRLEDVLYTYSNQKSGRAPYDKNTSYWVRYNTREKYIQLHTSKNDGEPFTYDVMINTKTGNVSLKDDAGNSITLDSPSGSVSVKVNKDINLTAGNNINLNAASTINLAAPNIVEKANSKSASSSNSVSQCSGTSVSQAGAIVNQASSITNNTPIVRNSGNVETAGSDTAHPNANAVH
jgi:hypothetical protein